MDDLQECPHCGRMTPEENLRCIYCSELLSMRKGVIGSFRFGGGKLIFSGVILFLVLFYVWRYFIR